jgi:NAD(P)-dependent dehydrogenase (short-subunit alcohol dehydrogenase family)
VTAARTAGPCGSKAALARLMCVLGLEPAPHNIRVNCVSPGVADTGMVQRPMATWGAGADPMPRLCDVSAMR